MEQILELPVQFETPGKDIIRKDSWLGKFSSAETVVPGLPFGFFSHISLNSLHAIFGPFECKEDLLGLFFIEIS